MIVRSEEDSFSRACGKFCYEFSIKWFNLKSIPIKRRPWNSKIYDKFSAYVGGSVLLINFFDRRWLQCHVEPAPLWSFRWECGSSSSFSFPSHRLALKEQVWVRSMASESIPKSTRSRAQEGATTTQDMCSLALAASASSACLWLSSCIPSLLNWGTSTAKSLSVALCRLSWQWFSCYPSTITISSFWRRSKWTKLKPAATTLLALLWRRPFPWMWIMIVGHKA